MATMTEAMKLPDLELPTHDGSAFTWTGKVGVAEESEMGRSYCGRVWFDAADVGFNVRSPRTGEVLPFAYDRPIVRGDEVVATVYRDLAGRGIEVHLLND